MDKTDRETLDFMNVESFSQLPFIRPAPPLLKEKGVGAIRLFGKEFGGTDDPYYSDSADDNNNAANKDGSTGDTNTNTETISSSSRKFECHYCCRNFPTSQALGGHQNAHKRERQQAKRAHLQSAAAMVHGGALADAAHVYGLINYRRVGSSAATLAMAPYHYTSRLYGGAASYDGHVQPQAINGSPLGLWRIPAAAASHNSTPYNTRHQIPLMFSSTKDIDHQLKAVSSLPSSQFRFGCESKADMKEHVSLDLHL